MSVFTSGYLAAKAEVVGRQYDDLVIETQADRPYLRALIANVLATDPGYLPGVTSGAVSLDAWLNRKQADHTYAFWLRGVMVAHVGMRLNSLLPDGTLLARPDVWEATCLVTHPAHRRRGLASRLLAHIADVYGDRAWVSVHEDNPGRSVVARLDWVVRAHEFYWPDDPVRGLVFSPPTPPAAD